ncbi:hypothetical protein BC835DRAFT_1423045 [Cytidiella melzeri]|nr:hypothetical protein BC835DRAFT_1423045 [Cytidiella melzeri]
MKRAGEAGDKDLAVSKRTKPSPPRELPTTEELIFDASKQLSATDVYEHGLVEDAFLAFEVSMKWGNDGKKARIQAQSTDKVRYHVSFLGPCARYFSAIGLQFHIGDTVLLSLKGASLEKKPYSSSSLTTLPIEISFESGVCLKFHSKKQPLAIGTFVNWWQSQEPRTATGDAPFQDDWYSTPSVNPVSEIAFTEVVPAETVLVQAASPTSGTSETASLKAEETSAGSTRKSSPEKITAVSAPESHAPEPRQDPIPKKLYRDNYPPRHRTLVDTASTKASSTKGRTSPVVHGGSGQVVLDNALGAKKAAKKAKREARKAALNGGENGGMAVSVPATHQAPPHGPSLKEPHVTTPSPASMASNARVAGTTKKASTLASASPVTAQPATTSAAPASQPKPAEDAFNITKIEGPWCRLRDVSVGKISCIIGVVAHVGDLRTSSSSEKYRRVILVDPTNIDEDSLTTGFTLTCFVKRAQECLSGIVTGDVLVMRNLIGESHKGGKLTGTCPSYKQWSWTIFHPMDGTLRSGGSALPPQSTQALLTPAENQYCIRLADWWLDVLKARKQDPPNESSVVQHISVADVAGQSLGREHKLIKDASPHAPPGGYFDCTVEILHGHMNDNGVYSLYVTDYTHNDSVASVSASWCVPALADLVFKIELWNEAALKGAELNPQDYYEIKNVRIRESTGGYWEGSFSEVKKLRKLDEEELDEAPHLLELLRRKKAWKDKVDANGTYKFPHMLVKDAQPDSHFDCTVEVLRISPKGDKALLYVTDYTSRSDLSFIPETAEWTRNIDHNAIVKVAVYNAQAKAAEGLTGGDIIAIRKMRLKSTANGALSGILGGDERLIYKLDPKTTGNEHCIELVRRQKAWESAQNRREEEKMKRKGPRKKPPVVEANAVEKVKKRTIPQRLPQTTCVRDLEKIHPDTGPARFLVLARVVDYYPDQIEDFVALYCSKCEEDLPDHLRICTTCDSDMMTTSVRAFYRFVLVIEDDEGARLHVPMASARDLACGFLEDLWPVDLHEDDEALEAFKKRLRPLLGELLDKHQELLDKSVDGDLDPDTSYHNMSLMKVEGHREVFFWDFTPVSRAQ